MFKRGNIVFGYVKPYTPELKVKESEIYKAVYCTLCRELGRNFGFPARLTLSYDFTFLALLRLAMAPGCAGFSQGRCTVNPLKKCNFCNSVGDNLDLVAAAGVMMMYYKLLDNIADGGFFKKIGYTIIRPIYAFPHRRAARRFPEIEAAVAAYIRDQAALEKAHCAGIDRAAEPTAKALSYIFSLCADEEKSRRVLERMGYLAGKWIYLIDALDDFEDDRKHGSYNVLTLLEESEEGAKKRILSNLNVCVDEIGKCASLLQLERYREIVLNVIYLGLPDVQKKVLNKKEKV